MKKVNKWYQSLIRLVTGICCIGFLSSCASNQVATRKDGYEQNLLQAINDSSQSISNSLLELNALANPYDAKIDLPFSNVKDNTLQKKVKLSWYGDVQPLLRKIASVIGYQFQVYGQKPALPVLIQIGSPEYPVIGSILYILQNLQIQAKSSAYIYIDTKHKLLSVRYTE